MRHSGAGATTDESFEALVSPQMTMLQRIAALYVRPSDRQDLVQDTLTQAWRKWNTFDAERGRVSTWLRAILVDQARQRWRNASPTLMSEVPGCAAPEAQHADRIDLRQAVDALPAGQRESVLLFYYADLPISEIALLLEAPVGTVKSWLHDGRSQLARRMHGYQS